MTNTLKTKASKGIFYCKDYWGGVLAPSAPMY